MSKSWRWYWMGALVVLLLTRWSALGAALLTPAEARLALEARSAVQEGVWPVATASPLLLIGNAALFWLFGSGSGIARLLPAAAGVLLALTPWFWRKTLALPERADIPPTCAAWSATVLLLLSPVALSVSRQVSGAALGTLGGVGVITALFMAEADERRRAGLLGVGLAVGLTGGPSFYDVLLAGLIAWAAWHWVERTPITFKRSCLRAVGAGLLAALLISLGGGWRWNGWAGPVEGLAAWLREWRMTSTPFVHPLLLGLYEPLALFLAAVGLGLAVRKRQSQLVALGAWAVLATALVVARPGADAAAFLAPLLPLALLGGWAVQHLLLPRRLTAGGWLAWVHVALGSVLWAFTVLVLLRQAGAPAYANGLELPLVGLVGVIQALMAAGFATLQEPRRALKGLAGGVMVALCLLQVGFAAGVAYVRPGNPAEPLVAIGVSDDVRGLQRTVEDLRVARALSPEMPYLTVVESDPALTDVWAVLTWALPSPALRRVAAWPADEPELVLTLEDVTPPAEARAAYRGMTFGVTLQSGGGIPGCEPGVFPPVCSHPLAWYFYRRSPFAPQIGHVVLWAKLPSVP